MLNLFSLTIPTVVKRYYFYNPDVKPEEFAANLERVNNLNFVVSNDLVWIELPDVNVELKPKQINNYLQQTETIENDERLFLKTVYRLMNKNFRDNGFVSVRNNLYISLKSKTALSTNPEISLHESYQTKLYKINNEYYLSITPHFTFLSSKPALESKAKSAYLFNIKSGKSFPYISSLDNVLTIQIEDGKLVNVKYPENYYFNYTTTEAEKFGFSKEMSKIYKEYSATYYRKIPVSLSFLSRYVNFEKTYPVSDQNKRKIVTTYVFKEGKAPVVREIFKLKPYQNNSSIKIAFFFPSEKTFNEIYPVLKTLFVDRNSVFYRTMLSELGFQKVEYIRHPSTKQSKFFYNEHTFELEDKEFFQNLSEKVFGIIILDRKYQSIDELPKNFPNIIALGPILKSKLKELAPYIMRSYMYKILNFSTNAQPYVIEQIPKDSLLIGMDLSHNIMTRESTLLLSAVDNYGKLIHIAQHSRLPLNEKMNVDTVEDEIMMAIKRYSDIYGRRSEQVYIFRDGIYIEDITSISTNLESEGIKHAFISVNKRSNINSEYTLAEHLIKLSDSWYVYFPTTLNLQSSIEIEIVTNKTEKSNDEIAEVTFLSTKLYHPTPYSMLKLPYPLYITDKVGRMPIAWKIYIPSN